MSYEVIATVEFLKDVKSILKIYPGFKKDIQKVISELEADPQQGSFLGQGLYKLRVSITGKGAGKSYGARVIHLVISIHQKVFLLKAYDKSDKSDLSPGEKKVLIARARSIQQIITKTGNS